MSKIKLEEIENYNKEALKNYLLEKSSINMLNEYFYIQQPEVISKLLNDIKDKNIVANTIFTTGFFWNQKVNEFQNPENIGKFLLRLSGHKDDNTIIETKQLNLEEQINYLDNINHLVEDNSELQKIFDIKEKSFLNKTIELINNEDFLNKVYIVYCNDWIPEKEMSNLIQNGVKLIQNLELMRKLDDKFKVIKSMKKYKI